MDVIVRKFNKNIVAVFLLYLVSLLLGLYKINYGLPSSYSPDEPVLVLPALRIVSYLMEGSVVLSMFDTGDFIYGAVPVYILAIPVFCLRFMINVTQVGEWLHPFVIVRSSSVFITSLIAVPIYYMSLDLFRNVKISFILSLILLTGWPLIHYAHFVNADIYLLLFLTTTFYFFLNYISTKSISHLVLAGIFLGLSIGTKISAIMLLPVFVCFLSSKSLKVFIHDGAVLMIVIIATFFLSNPFTLIELDEAATRYLEIREREASIVYTSVDFSATKYISALIALVSPPIFLLFCLNIFVLLACKRADKRFMFLYSVALVTVVVYTLIPRRVDRWVLYLCPILYLGAMHALLHIKSLSVRVITVVAFLLFHLSFSFSILYQLSSPKPRALAFAYYQKSIQNTKAKTLVYTEDGTDSFQHIPLVDVIHFNVYSNKADTLPQNLNTYDYVVLSSKVRNTYQSPYFKRHKKDSYLLWQKFEGDLSHYMKLDKSFITTDLNLLKVAEIYIYKKPIQK